MLLTIDGAAGSVFFSVQFGSFSGRNPAIGFSNSFIVLDLGFSGFEMCGFSIGQLAAFFTLGYTCLLVALEAMTNKKIETVLTNNFFFIKWNCCC